jgi:CRISPR-associated endonuclease/helicase Cas3
MTTTDNELPLPGLDGTNPLGFLAALGLYRVVYQTPGHEAAHLHWQARGGTWVPVLTGTPLNEASLLDLLDQRLARMIEDHPVALLKDLSEEDPSKRRALFDDIVRTASRTNRDMAEWLAALASDMIPPAAISQLQTTRRDYHYGNLTSVIARTTRGHLRRAIVAVWDYADALDNQSLHLDPGEDRRHAHQWNKPAGDPDRKTSGGMLGANRLAIEAVPFFISVPNNNALHTVGFTGQRSYDTRWTWPLWDVPMSYRVIQSAMLLTELQEESISSNAQKALMRRGVVAAFRTRRILVGKTPNFTPPQQVA